MCIAKKSKKTLRSTTKLNKIKNFKLKKTTKPVTNKKSNKQKNELQCKHK